MRKIFFSLAILAVLGCGGQSKPKTALPVEEPIIIGEKGKTIDSIINDLYKKEKFFGNVLIAEKGSVIYRKSFGKSDL